jgi:hypothetical protein
MERYNRAMLQKQKAQALTEFIITAAFVLVPLFLMVPLIAKYIDIKHATINAARYQAWEYTVWHNALDDHDIFNNFSAAGVPYKTPSETAAEAERRFFSRIQEGTTTIPISPGDKGGWVVGEENPFWKDHAGNRILIPDDNNAIATGAVNTGQETPGFKIFGVDTSAIFNVILKVVDFGFEFFGALLSFMGGDSEFGAINTEGYSTTTMTVPFNEYPLLFNPATSNDLGPAVANINTAQTGTGTFVSNSAILSEVWGSGGTDHTYEQVAGALPTTLLRTFLDLPVVGEMWDAVSMIAPELTRCNPTFSPAIALGFIEPEGSLWFGHVDSDTVHPDRLSGGGTHVCDDAGRCRLEPDEEMAHTSCIP